MTDTAIDRVARPQSAEIVPSEQAQPPSLSSTSNAEGRQPTVSIDSISKTLAVVLVFVYVSGFLITSLHNFQYGFSEMNPLRPRILAAGGWFGIFIAVPFSLAWELRKHSAASTKKINISDLSALVVAYMGSAIFLINFSGGLFSFDDASVSLSQSSDPWWKVVLFVVGILAAIVAIVTAMLFVVSKLKPHVPKWLGPALILAAYGYGAFSAYSNIFIKHSFASNAMYFWILMTGGYIYFECQQRHWILKPGFWQRTLIGFFVMMTIFSTVYYPHIKAKWGGGALIPIEFTFSKDAPIRSNVVVDSFLIDETDAGFYVVEKGKPFATFVPRTEISSIYYGQGTKHSMFSEGLPQEVQSTPSNNCSPRTLYQPVTPAEKPQANPALSIQQQHK